MHIVIITVLKSQADLHFLATKIGTEVLRVPVSLAVMYPGSADTRTLVVSRMSSSFGDRTFAAAKPQVCNSLLPNLRLRGLSYGQFRWLLKTFFGTVRSRRSVICF